MARARVQPLLTPTARVRARGDIVEEQGLLAIGASHDTPEQARTSDLLFLADALEAAGVELMLLRTDEDRPVLAVRESARVDVFRALVDACASEPFYAQELKRNRAVGRGTPTLVADGDLAHRPDAHLLRLFRPRVDPAGRMLPLVDTAVQLEFWEFSGPEIRVPAPNALTRRRFLADELEVETVERWGRQWRTIRDMFTPLADDITFPVDIVFSWVDGTDKEWQRARARRMESYVVGEGDEAEARFRQIDELRYALRSVHTYLPWVRNILIATDSPAPGWLAEHDRVRIVRSEEFFADPEVLPTHNSQAVESQLHRIDGLSEHFLYSNDDMFIGRPLGPEAFFSPGGITKFVEASTRIGLGENTARRSGFENAARMNRRLIRDRFGRLITRHLEHAATPLRRSVIAEMAEVWPEQFTATAASRFRAATNISVTNSLYHYYALLTGRAVQNTDAEVLYVDTTTHKGLGLMRGLLKRRAWDFFCLNDGSFPEVGPEERARKVRSFLERYFPVPAPWEKPAEEVSPAGAG
jgi:UDP-glucose 4-epimerase